MKIREAMTATPVTLPPNASVYEAVVKMVSKSIGSILVTKEDEIEGILTERDILSRVVACNRDSKVTKLEEIMSKPVLNIEGDLDVNEAAELMKNKNIRRLAVVNGKGKLVGIITSDDIARSLRRSVEELATTYYIMARARERK